MERNLLKQPVTTLTGIGNRTAKLLEKLGILLLQDLLFHLPIRYEDKTHILPIAALSAGMTAFINGHVKFIDILPRGRRSLICRIGDSTGSIDLRFFHFTARQHATLKPGVKVSCFGEIRYGYAGLEMVHPEYTVITDEQETIVENYLTPVYPLTEGLSQNIIRRAVKQVLGLCESDSGLVKDWLPETLLKQTRYPFLVDAIKTLHAPDSSVAIDALLNGTEPSIKRLAFEELLTHHLNLKLTKQKAKSWQTPLFSIDKTLVQAFIGSLPFKLTEAQNRVMSEITSDLGRPYPMMRLVQGDVGSGKTIVAAIAASIALDSGFQTAIMAPTEILAEQHHRNFSGWFKDSPKHIAFLSGQLRGKQKVETLERVSNGSAGLVIGTHALFQDDVNFHRLGLIIIDEQHRFGVHQRLRLRAKGQQGNCRPHQLVMTATPIPRTLAMLQFADLDISVIDQLPPGRKPVTTSVIPSDRRDEVISRIDQWVAKKKQAYWVCTLIEESESLQCEAAEKTALRLASVLPDVRIGLLHGRIKAAEKDAIMSAFKNRDIDLLVATTVIEVGVDVPNASLMIIENPERLGLSQLHQLRGRVGRGVDESFCLLLYQAPLSENARHRLGILRESNDGFYIAEKDLQLRGPGDVMGTRQTGLVSFKIADLVRDAELLDNIPSIADMLLTDMPESVTPLIERWLGHRPDYSEV